MSDDEEKDDYLSETNIYSYFFKFSENADTFKFIPPVIIDDYSLSERGVEGTAVHFTVAPELQGEEIYLGTSLKMDGNSISGECMLIGVEQIIGENDTEGYIEFNDISENTINKVAGKRTYDVMQYNGLTLYSFEESSYGTQETP